MKKTNFLFATFICISAQAQSTNLLINRMLNMYSKEQQQCNSAEGVLKVSSCAKASQLIDLLRTNSSTQYSNEDSSDTDAGSWTEPKSN